MLHNDIVSYIKRHPKKYTSTQIAEHFFPGKGKENYNKVNGIITRGAVRKLILQEPTGIRSPLQEFVMKKAQKRALHKPKELIPRAPNTKNVLIIGDLHEPFTLEGYREFCYDTYKKYECTHVIFIGDIIDNHYASYHETDPDGLGGGEELDLAVKAIGEWVKLFPKADVIIGNHDRLIMRKAFTGGIPKRWIMEYKDVLEAPGWNFVEERTYDNVHYIHGEGSTARTRARKDLMSTVQGHRHPEAYNEFVVGETFKIFGMQVGCGVDRKSYAMAYAKAHPKPAIGCGVILNHGEQPINVMMTL